jgi:hypothetical protein
VHGRQVDVVRFLLQWGADATVIVPLFVNADGKLPPQEANLLYIALSLRHPLSDRGWRRYVTAGNPPPSWEGFPRDATKKKLMALLLAHGSSESTTMDTILEHLTALAKEARCTEEKFLQALHSDPP